MEKKYISKYQSTQFYIDFENKTYGIIINIKDIDRKEEIIQHIRRERVQSINKCLQIWKGSAA